MSSYVHNVLKSLSFWQLVLLAVTVKQHYFVNFLVPNFVKIDEIVLFSVKKLFSNRSLHKSDSRRHFACFHYCCAVFLKSWVRGREWTALEFFKIAARFSETPELSFHQILLMLSDCIRKKKSLQSSTVVFVRCDSKPVRHDCTSEIFTHSRMSIFERVCSR